MPVDPTPRAIEHTKHPPENLKRTAGNQMLTNLPRVLRNSAENLKCSRRDSSPSFHTTDTNKRVAPPLRKLKKSLCPTRHSPHPNDKNRISRYNYPPKWSESGLEISNLVKLRWDCLLYTSPSPRDR